MIAHNKNKSPESIEKNSAFGAFTRAFDLQRGNKKDADAKFVLLISFSMIARIDMEHKAKSPM